MALSEPEIFDALDGLKAFDGGATDSGIRDERLRYRVKVHLTSLPIPELRTLIARFLRLRFLTLGQRVKGYGVEDARCFLDWLGSDMGLDWRRA